MAVIPSLGAGVLWLLAPFPRRFLGVVLGIVQVIRAIAPRRGLGAAPEKVSFELPFFTFDLFDFLVQLGDALQGIAMATSPISDLLAELEVLALETLDLVASSANPWRKVRTRIVSSEEEPVGGQTCTSWPSMTTLVYPARQKKRRGWWSLFIRTRATGQTTLLESERLSWLVVHVKSVKTWA